MGVKLASSSANATVSVAPTVARGRRTTPNRSEFIASSKFVTTTHSSEASSDNERTTASIIGSPAMGIFGFIVSYPSRLKRSPRPHAGTTTRMIVSSVRSRLRVVTATDERREVAVARAHDGLDRDVPRAPRWAPRPSPYTEFFVRYVWV